MKKLLLILLLAVSAPAMADKFIIERGWGDDLTPNAPNSTTWFFKGIRTINENFDMDVALQTTQIEATAPNNKVSSRVDVGAIPKIDLYGPIRGYTRFAVGEKITSTSPGNFSYYSIEPGITAPLGYGFSTKIGWRYRSAFDDAIHDTTRTWRTSLNYEITKQDTVGIRLDTQRGDQNLNIWNLNYVRSF